MKAFLDYNILCPKCNKVMVRFNIEHKNSYRKVMECDDLMCKQHGKIYLQPTVELESYRAPKQED